MADFRLVSLHVHPIKSCRAIDLHCARIGSVGLEHDRSWMVVDGNGRFITQRTHPALARVAVAITDAGLTLHAAADTAPLHVQRPTADAPLRRVEVWRDTVLARSAGAAAAEFFSRLLGIAAELVAVGAETQRTQCNEWTEGVAVPVHFADGYPLLVCNRASLDALNARLPEPLPMTRFRPNLVIEGLAAFEEDAIDSIDIGPVTLRFAKPCTRCGMTGVDQQTGLRANDPLEVLRAFRYDALLKGVTFGQNATVVRGAGESLRVGDAVRVSRRARPAR